MAGDHESERPDLHEGGPVKTFLEHLEDFRWVMVKSVVALFLAMLLCLMGANYICVFALSLDPSLTFSVRIDENV